MGRARFVIACCLSLMLLFGAAGCPAAGGGGSADGGVPTARMLFSDLNAALLSISGTSQTDVYAVGADSGDGLGPYVVHYNGQEWERLNSRSSGDLWWISVTPISGDFFMGGTNGKVLRFHPADQSFDPLVTPGGNSDIVFGLWGMEATRVWAVGGDLDRPDDSGFVWRFDGSEWGVENVNGAGLESLPILYKVWGRSAEDVYAVGRFGIVLHFDGSDWSLVPTGTTRTLFTIHGDAQRIFAVGGFADAVILEQAGATFVDRALAGMPQMNGVFVGVDGAVAVGNEGSVARRGDAGWVLDESHFDTTRDFHATWVDPRGGIWAVGGNLSASMDDGMLAYLGTADISTIVAR